MVMYSVSISRCSKYNSNFHVVIADATSDYSPELKIEAQQFAETSQLFLNQLDEYVKERRNSSSTPKTLSLFSR